MNDLAVIPYDELRQIIRQAQYEEVAEIRDQSEALRHYLKDRGESRRTCNLLKRASIVSGWRIGELIKDRPKNKGSAGQGNPNWLGGIKFIPPSEDIPTLAEVGIDKNEASLSRAFYAIPFDKLEAFMARFIESDQELTDAAVYRLGKQYQSLANLKTNRPLPVGQYGLIYADPPWRYKYSKSDSRMIENHYPTMDLGAICLLPVSEIAAGDSVLFLWATSPKLAESMQVMEAWGFVYRTCLVWDKEIMGMGYYARQQHELLLIAIRGEPGVPDPADRPPSVIRIRRKEHSAKPVEFYDLIERMYPYAAKIELFARATRQGWDAWGNQIAEAES